MKKYLAFFVLLLSLSASAKIQSIVNCIDGSRSMIVTNIHGKMIGTLNDFDLQLEGMSCGWIPNTKTLRCDSGDYYVIIFKGASSEKLTVQLNLKGDFGQDSGYLHSLICK